MSRLEGSLRRSIARSKKFTQKFNEVLQKTTERERVGGYGNIMKQVLRKIDVYCYNGSIYYFDGCIYRKISQNELDSYIINTLEKMGATDADLVNGRPRILKAVRDGYVGKTFRPDSRKLCFKNCVLDLDTFTVKGFSHHIRALYQIDYEYNPNDKNIGVWTKFLNRSLPDKSVQAVLQEALGSIFVGKSAQKTEKIFCLWGFGQNGKSVIQETVKGVLGGNNSYFSAIPMKDLASEGAGHFNIDRIVGKLVNFCSDMNEKIFESETAKILISRETILASQKNKTPYETDDLPVQFCCLNQLPQSKSFAEGRRIMVIPFFTSIPKHEVDPALCSKLRNEYSGILNWIIEGAKRYIKSGYKFTHSDAVENVFAEYEKISCPPMNFMLSSGWTLTPQSYVREPDLRITPQALYAMYSDFCMKNNVEDVGERMFYRTLLKKGYKKSGLDYVLYLY